MSQWDMCFIVASSSYVLFFPGQTGQTRQYLSSGIWNLKNKEGAGLLVMDIFLAQPYT